MSQFSFLSGHSLYSASVIPLMTGRPLLLVHSCWPRAARSMVIPQMALIIFPFLPGVLRMPWQSLFTALLPLASALRLQPFR